MTAPTTDVIVWERRGRLAVEARRQLDDVSAPVKDVRDEREFRAAIHKSHAPVVILDRAVLGEKLADALVTAAIAEALVVVVGIASADEKRRDRDLGALLLLDDLPDRLAWRGTLRRLVRAAQARSALPAGNRGAPGVAAS